MGSDGGVAMKLGSALLHNDSFHFSDQLNQVSDGRFLDVPIVGSKVPNDSCGLFHSGLIVVSLRV